MGLSKKVAAAPEALSRCPLGAIIPKSQNVVYLEHNSSVGSALQVLARRHILSAPLVVVPGLEDMDTGAGSGEEGATAPQLIGWVTVESILRAFLAHMEEKHGKLPRNMLLLMTQLEKEGPAFAEKPLITVSGSEDRGLLFQVHSDVSLLTALRESFVPPGKPAAHRLAVFDPAGNITAVISQLDVIRYIREHPEVLGDLAHATVRQLGWAPPPGASAALSPSPSKTSASGAAPASSSPPGGPTSAPTARTSIPGGSGSPASAPGSFKPLLTVEASLPALLAYERMARAGVSGAPVVADPEAALGGGGGAMIANLSMSDLRNIQSQHLGILALPVGEFLALLHNTTYLGYSQRTSAQAAHPFFASGPPTALMPRSPSVSSSGSGHGVGAPGRVPSPALGRRSSSGLGGGRGAGGDGGGAVPMEATPEAAREGEEVEGEEADWGIRMITCNGDTTLTQLLSLLSDNKVHRVYVTAPAAAGQQQQPAGAGAAAAAGGGGDGGSPLGGPVRAVAVITPTDILRLLASAGSKAE